MNIWAQIDSGFGQWTIGVYKFVVYDLWFTDSNPGYKCVQCNWGYLFFSCPYYHAWSFVHSLFYHCCNWLRVFDLWCYVTGAEQRRRQRRRVLPHQDSSRPQEATVRPLRWPLCSRHLQVPLLQQEAPHNRLQLPGEPCWIHWQIHWRR
jgi:hypothetical protein